MAIDAHVAEIRDDDSVGFHHPAFQEVVYAELLPGERGAAAPGRRRGADPGDGPAARGRRARWPGTGTWRATWNAPWRRRWPRAAPTSRCTRSPTPTRASAWPSSCWTGCRPPWTGSTSPSARPRPRARVGDSAAAVRLLEDALAHDRRDPDPRRLLERLGSVHFVAGRRRGVPGRRSGRRWSCCPTTTRAGSPPACTPGSRCSPPPGPGSTTPTWPAPARCGSPGWSAPGARRDVALNALGIVAGDPGRPGPGDRPAPRGARRSPARSQNPHDVGLAYVNLSHVLGLAGRLDDGVALCHEGIARAEPVRPGPAVRLPAAVQHQRRADQGGAAGRGGGADRRGAQPAPARGDGGAGAAAARPGSRSPRAT